MEAEAVDLIRSMKEFAIEIDDPAQAPVSNASPRRAAPPRPLGISGIAQRNRVTNKNPDAMRYDSTAIRPSVEVSETDGAAMPPASNMHGPPSIAAISSASAGVASREIYAGLIGVARQPTIGTHLLQQLEVKPVPVISNHRECLLTGVGEVDVGVPKVAATAVSAYIQVVSASSPEESKSLPLLSLGEQFTQLQNSLAAMGERAQLPLSTSAPSCSELSEVQTSGTLERDDAGRIALLQQAASDVELEEQRGSKTAAAVLKRQLQTDAYYSRFMPLDAVYQSRSGTGPTSLALPPPPPPPQGRALWPSSVPKERVHAPLNRSILRDRSKFLDLGKTRYHPSIFRPALAPGAPSSTYAQPETSWVINASTAPSPHSRQVRVPSPSPAPVVSPNAHMEVVVAAPRWALSHNDAAQQAPAPYASGLHPLVLAAARDIVGCSGLIDDEMASSATIIATAAKPWDSGAKAAKPPAASDRVSSRHSSHNDQRRSAAGLPAMPTVQLILNQERHNSQQWQAQCDMARAIRASSSARRPVNPVADPLTTIATGDLTPSDTASAIQSRVLEKLHSASADNALGTGKARFVVVGDRGRSAQPAAQLGLLLGLQPHQYLPTDLAANSLAQDEEGLERLLLGAHTSLARHSPRDALAGSDAEAQRGLQGAAQRSSSPEVPQTERSPRRLPPPVPAAATARALSPSFGSVEAVAKSLLQTGPVVEAVESLQTALTKLTDKLAELNKRRRRSKSRANAAVARRSAGVDAGHSKSRADAASLGGGQRRGSDSAAARRGGHRRGSDTAATSSVPVPRAAPATLTPTRSLKARRRASPPPVAQSTPRAQIEQATVAQAVPAVAPAPTAAASLRSAGSVVPVQSDFAISWAELGSGGGDDRTSDDDLVYASVQRLGHVLDEVVRSSHLTEYRSPMAAAVPFAPSAPVAPSASAPVVAQAATTTWPWPPRESSSAMRDRSSVTVTAQAARAAATPSAPPSVYAALRDVDALLLRSGLAGTEATFRCDAAPLAASQAELHAARAARRIQAQEAQAAYGLSPAGRLDIPLQWAEAPSGPAATARSQRSVGRGTTPAAASTAAGATAGLRFSGQHYQPIVPARLDETIRVQLRPEFRDGTRLVPPPPLPQAQLPPPAPPLPASTAAAPPRAAAAAACDDLPSPLSLPLHTTTWEPTPRPSPFANAAAEQRSRGFAASSSGARHRRESPPPSLTGFVAPAPSADVPTARTLQTPWNARLPTPATTTGLENASVFSHSKRVFLSGLDYSEGILWPAPARDTLTEFSVFC